MNGARVRSVFFLMAAVVTAVVTGISARHAGAMTLDQVQKMIRDKGYHWTAGRTSVSDWGWDSLRASLTFRLPADYAQRPKVDLSANGKAEDLPSRWDWREHGGDTPVKNQRSCGSCWAFASVATLEGCARIDDHIIYDLSEQQVLSCNLAGQGCGGGTFDTSREVFRRMGAVGEDCMPYAGVDGIQCTADRCEVLARITDAYDIVNSVPSIKAACYANGPVLVAMAVTDDFRYYTGGCYQNPIGGELNHAVSIFGWDDHACDGMGAWIVKNSWGTGWGDGGWFYIHYGDCQIGDGANIYIHAPGHVVDVQHPGLPTTTQARVPILVAADIESRAGCSLNPDSILLAYRVNGGDFTTVLMRPAGQPGRWSAEIPGQERPATVEYYMRAADQEGHCGFSPDRAPDRVFAFDVARVYEDFERPGPGWSVGGADDDAVTGIWERVDPVGSGAQPEDDHTPGGTICWVTGQHTEGESDGADDVDGGQTTLTSPGYDLSDARTATVKYWRWYSNDTGAGAGDDEWVVQVRNNQGPWTDIERTKVSSKAWVQAQDDLVARFGSALGVVEFRFVASDRGNPSCVEAALDDFEIFADQGLPSAARPSAEPPIRVGGASPNPVTDATLLSFSLAVAAPVRVGIYDVSGRLVRALARGDLARGPHQCVWDRRDDAGRLVASGAYYWTVQGGGIRAMRQVVVVR